MNSLIHEGEAIGMPATEARALLARCTIAAHLGVSPAQVVDTARFREDLDADSLDIAALANVLEETFNIRIEDEDADAITTVAEAIAYIEGKVTGA